MLRDIAGAEIVGVVAGAVFRNVDGAGEQFVKLLAGLGDALGVDFPAQVIDRAVGRYAIGGAADRGAGVVVYPVEVAEAARDDAGVFANGENRFAGTHGAGQAAIGEKEGAAADLSFSLWSVIKLFVVGVIASATMVIPGVSGSMMLLLIGYYNPIVASIKNFVTALVSLDMAGIMQGCGVLVPMGIGIVVGVFAIAKLIEIIFEKFPIQAYWAIIGLIVASPFAIFLLGEVGTVTALSIVVSVLTFGIGFLIAMKLGE